MTYENIILEENDAICTIFINRPKALNALNHKTLTELYHCLLSIASNEQISVVIITGGGEKAFVAGADIGYMKDLDPLKAREFSLLGYAVMKTIEELPQPVIAAVNGFALGGGCELILACDFRYASGNAKIGQPEVSLGILPGFGGSQRLPRLIGKGLAAELIYSGNVIDAEEALRIGLVNKIFPQEDLLTGCLEIAERIRSNGPLAVKLSKEALNNGLEMEMLKGCRYETELFSLCFASSEQKEGMSAFMQKRKPEFNSFS